MRKIMGKAGIVCRIVLAANSDCDISLDTGFILVDSHIDLEPVLEGIDLRFERISLDRCVLGAT